MSETTIHVLSWRERLYQYARLTRQDKPVGTLLLLWPTLWGLWLAAGGMPSIHILLIFVFGTWLMRSAGCAINDYADRDFDKHVARTKDRPVTSGKISPKEALLVAFSLTAVACLLLIPLNLKVWFWAAIAAFLAGSYPFTKRFFPLPQAYLGIAFGFGIPMAFAAVQESVPLVAWLLLLANICWSIAYDTAYAMVDREDDLKIGIQTAAITFGKFDIMMIVICYGVMLGLLLIVGRLLHFGALYYVSLMVCAGLMIYFSYRLKSRISSECFQVFRQNHWIGLIVFLGIVIQKII